METKITRREAESVLKTLPLIQETVLRGIYQRGMGVQEIGRKLHRTCPTVRKIKSRALKELGHVLVSKRCGVRFDIEEILTKSRK